MNREMREMLEFYAGECRRRSASDSVAIRVSNLRKIIDQARAPEQTDMFATPPPPPELPSEVPTHDSPTSIKAAKKVAPTFKNTMGRFLCALALKQYSSGLIREQLCFITNTKNQTACGALNSLETAGFVVSDGERANQDGNDCKIYHITEKGQKWVNSQQR